MSIRSYIFRQLIIYVLIAASTLAFCYIAADLWYWNIVEDRLGKREYTVTNTIDEYKEAPFELFEEGSITLLLLDDNYEVVYHKGVKRKDELNDISDDISDDARYLHSKSISDGINNITVEENIFGLYYIDEYIDDESEILTGYILKNLSESFIATPKLIATVYTSSLVVITLAIVSLFVYLLINRIYKKVKQSYKLISSNIEKVPYERKPIDLDNIKLSETAQVAETYNTMIDEMNKINDEKANLAESNNRLISNLSHDLKSPLTTLKGYSEMMIGEESDIEKLKTCAEFINNSTIDLDYLVNVLFEQIKMQNADYSLNVESDDINEFLRGICANYYMIFTDKGFSMEVDIPEDKVYLNFDKENLKRVFVNILENCYSHNQEPTQVLVKAQVKDNHYLVSFKDNGVGIPEDAKDKIFEAFYQVDSSRQGNNSGLGLFIAKQIVEKHGGEISYISQKDYRTVFEIRLPLA